MAARTKKILHDSETRARIQVSMIINRLAKHLAGEIELTPTQVRCGEILLRKVLPDLAATEHTGEVKHSYVVELPAVAIGVDSWQQQHKPRIQ